MSKTYERGNRKKRKDKCKQQQGQRKQIERNGGNKGK
jgi:hypothetical protein